MSQVLGEFGGNRKLSNDLMLVTAILFFATAPEKSMSQVIMKHACQSEESHVEQVEILYMLQNRFWRYKMPYQRKEKVSFL